MFRAIRQSWLFFRFSDQLLTNSAKFAEHWSFFQFPDQLGRAGCSFDQLENLVKKRNWSETQKQPTSDQFGRVGRKFVVFLFFRPTWPSWLQVGHSSIFRTTRPSWSEKNDQLPTNSAELVRIWCENRKNDQLGQVGRNKRVLNVLFMRLADIFQLPSFAECQCFRGPKPKILSPKYGLF